MRIVMTHTKRLIGLLLLMGVFGRQAEAQIPFYPSPRSAVRDPGMGLLAKSPTRSIVDLNGRWHYKASEDLEWKEMSVPSSYTTEQRLTFTRQFTVDAELLRSSVFQLVAVCISYYCEIKINNQFVGKHAGLSSFNIKLFPGIVKPGNNTITIEVHNSLNAQETVPLREQLRSARNYGGIIGDIALVTTNAVWVQETVTKSTVSGEGKPATLQYQAFLNSGAVSTLPGDSTNVSNLGPKPVDHYIEIYDASSGALVARSDVKRIEIDADRLVPVDIVLSIPAVHLWSPESPYLYVIHQKTLQNNVLLDETYTQIGFRNFTVEGTSFHLNGSSYFIKGLTYIEDSPYHGRSLSLEEYERDVLLLKNLGVNAIRLPHGSAHPYLLSLCDRYGLLVFYEFSVSNAPASILRQESFIASARNILKESTARDNSHPSIVAWGFASGIDGLAGWYDVFFREMAQRGKITDRLTYASFSSPMNPALTQDLDFYAFDLFDASRKNIQKLVDEFPSQLEDKPLLLSSVSYPVEIGNYNGYSDPRSIDAQAQFFLDVYNLVASKHLAGIIVHTFCDYSVSFPLMSTDRVHQFTATFGVVDAYRQKRLSYDILKAKFNNEKPLVLVVGNYLEEYPSTFVVVGLLIIFLFAVVYNVFRRFRENVVRSFLRPHNFFTDVRDQRMLSIFQTSMVGVLGVFSSGLIAANFMYFWKTNSFFDFLVFQFFPNLWIKQWLNFAAWNPLSNIIAFATSLFVLLLAYAVILRTVAFFLKRNVLLFDAYSIAMWSVLPVIMLAPLGMILHRIMGIPFFEFSAVIVLLVFLLWMISRLLKGTAVVLDLRPIYFYFFGYLVLVLALGIWLYSLDNQTALFGYLRYLFDIWSFNGSLQS